MKLRSRIALVVAALMIVGCSVVDERKQAYKDAKLLPPLEVPPDLLSVDAKNDLAADVSATEKSITLSEFSQAETQAEEREGKAGAERVAPQSSLGSTVATGASLGVALSTDEVKLARDGNHYWLEAPGELNQWWSAVKQFWLSNEIEIERENMPLAMMYTAWFEDRSQFVETSFFQKAFSKLRSTNLRDQYVVRFENNAQAGYVEIHIVHRGMRHVEYGDNLRWLPRGRDPELELEMLKKLALYIDVGEERAQTMMAQASQTIETVSLQTQGDVVWLKLRRSFAQAWKQVGDEILAAGYELEDLNRSEGLYYVHGDLFQEIDKANVFSAFTGEKKGEDKPFIVKLQTVGDFVRVDILPREGSEISSSEIESFLSELADELE